MSNCEDSLLLKSLCRRVVRDTSLEARDSYGNWYPVKVLAVDKSKVLVHFCNWSSRYDSWYPINSSCLRPMQKISPRETPKLIKPSPHSSIDKGDKNIDSTGIHFEVGSYVMAAWRNDFEYLAEVLAHRQRHGTKAEYRLRYIWDRVVEWTPVNKLRKATQYEIDYVLKFCKEKGTLSASKVPNKLDPQHSCSSDSSSGTPRAKRMRTTLSENKSRNRSSEPETIRYRSRSTRVVTSSSSILEYKKPLHPTFYDGIIEQDGMVYEKSVFQFHEACRRRRELKRKAIEDNETHPHTFNSSVSVSNQTSMGQLIHRTSLDHIALESLESSSMKVENYTPSVVPLISPPGSSVSSYQKCNEVEIQTLEKTSHLQNNSSDLLGSIKCNDATQRPRRTIVGKKGTETKVPSISVSSEVFTKVSTKSSAPVVYPCPYCSRQLRNSKLRDAHITNYHKGVPGSTKCTTYNEGGIYQNRYSSWKSHMHSFSHEPVLKRKSSELNPDPSSAPEFTRLLSCHCRDSRSYATEKESGLIQCSHCLCWLHCLCYNTSFNTELHATADVLTDNKFHSSVVCFNCRMVLRSVRKSRRNEWRTELLQSRNCDSKFSTPNLLIDISSILNNVCQLRSLLASGWQILNRSTLPSVTEQFKQDSGIFKNAYQDTSKPNEFQNSKFTENSKHTASFIHTPEDQVNRLYMELRGIAFGSLSEANGEVTASKCDNSHLPNDNHTFCISTPESECPNTSWPLDETVNGSAQSESLSYQVTDATYHIGSQDLSGFLQDLGPDIIPEISGFNVDGVINSGSTTSDSCAVDEFLKIPRSYTDQPCVSQNGDKLSSENTTCQLLGSHPSVTNSSDKYLGSILDVSASEDSTLSPLKYFGTTACNNHLGSVQQFPSCDSNSLCSTSLNDKPTIQLAVDAKVNMSTNDVGVSIIESSRGNSTVHLGTGVGSDIINLPIPKCARTIISDLLSSPLSDEFVTPCSNQQSDFKGSNVLPTSYTPNEFSHLPSTSALHSLDIDWLEAAAHSHSVNSSSSPVYPNDVKVYDHPTLNDFSDLSNNVTDLGNRRTFRFPIEQLEKLAQTQTDLVNLDEYILTPFENALSVMEAQLDAITTHVTNLERLHKYDHHDNLNTERKKVSKDTEHQETEQVFTTKRSPHTYQLSNAVCTRFSWRNISDKDSFSSVLERAQYNKYKIHLETYLHSAKAAAQHLYRLQKVSDSSTDTLNAFNGPSYNRIDRLSSNVTSCTNSDTNTFILPSSLRVLKQLE
ncbi:PHD finger protein [Schistosoma japonicum]|uniref:PHD finger protein n=2 Tax=Schistosoma japonicum TaxID=6182 RepID=A0A4Z2D1J0_SCHJA|nr:PHD finger protein [Schistosoma japonicum]KAH8866012.1 PHD finger protein [Schistosoma japonicum]TNN10060.1 PHD finger protein [Schistosoma japonicum]